MAAKIALQTLFLVMWSFLAFPLVCKTANVRILREESVSPTPGSDVADDIRTTLIQLLHSLNEESCKNAACVALDSEQTHINFKQFFKDLRLLLDDTSAETLKMRLQDKQETSANILLHSLVNISTSDEFTTYIYQHPLLQSAKITKYGVSQIRRKRGILSWLSDEGSYLENKLENMDWKTAVKRAGQVYTVVQAARSVSDPSQMAVTVGLTVGKLMLTEAVEDKLNEWWNEFTG